MKIFILCFQLLISINIISNSCHSGLSIYDETCFNEVIFFNTMKNRPYRAGHFAMNSKGDLIIEYSYDSYRLFYGLKKNGKYYFPEIIKEIEIETSYENPKRYESVNCFDSIENESDENKKLLLSISSYKTIMELHDLETGDYSVFPLVYFLDNADGIYSYVFQILEKKVGDNYYYFLIYIDPEDFWIKLRKFSFRDYNIESIGSIGRINMVKTEYVRITSSIINDNLNVLIIFYMANYEYRAVIFANYYESPQSIKQVNQIASYSNLRGGDGYFFKAVYLYSNYIAFICFRNLQNFELNILNMNTDYSMTKKITYEGNTNIKISGNITMNEFLKINNERFVLLSIRQDSYELNPSVLYIIFFDFYQNYNYIKVRYYSYDFRSDKFLKFSSEISAFIYNDFLIFTATYIYQGLSLETISPILLMFGYPNGTDFEMDISPYFIDSENYTGSINLYNDLFKTMKIINNIFGYEIVEQIKLVSIPDEILFYNSVDNSRILNNENFDVNYYLKQNEEIIKDNIYYYLDYQFIVKEPDYNRFYSNTYAELIDGDIYSNMNDYFTSKFFYGRTNTLKFKLCHQFCKTCKKIGISINNQKCESCLDEYTYFSNDVNDERPYSECIPEGYFYDKEKSEIEQCTSENSKFYIDNNNKTICFKSGYECPIHYQDYNESTKECKYREREPSSSLSLSLSTSIITNEIQVSSYINNPSTFNIIHSTKKDFTSDIKSDMPINIKSDISTDIKTDIQTNIKSDIQTNIKSDLQTDIKTETKFESNEDINNRIDNILIKNYTIYDDSIEIKGENNSIFQLTTAYNELERYSGKKSNNNSLSILDLGNCENDLKTYYKINSSLIIKKYEQITTASERNIQYEVYHPETKIKLNLSLCISDTIDIYIPIDLDEKLFNLYEDLQKSGYDLFNINDPFYNDICTPYKSENDTDILLSDRKNDIYNNNYTTCQSNCQYSAFESKYKFLKCECKVIVDDIDIHKFNKFSKKIFKNFYSVLKNSNFKTLKCYNLVFNSNYISNNIGNFIVLSFFVGYFCFFVIYIIKGITPFQLEAIKILQMKFKNINIYDININIFKNANEEIIQSPPQKRKTAMIKSGLSLNKNMKKDKRKSAKNIKKTQSITNNNLISINDKLLNNNKNQLNIETKKEIIEKKETNNARNKRKSKSKKRTTFRKSSEIKLDIDTTNNNNEILDDLDLDNLSYEKAIDLDKRTFLELYLRKLKSKHLIIYTFISCHDHNLFYIKLSRFIFLICTNMALNVIFFFDSSMHKIYLDYGKYNFIQRMPEKIYSSIISLVIELLIGMLSYTDVNLFQIRQIQEYNTHIITKIFNKVKIKLIVYFIITFLLFLFYWYLISSFCAVYNNTQSIYIKDFITSFSLGLLYPFIIQLCFALLRIFSFKSKTKFRKILYIFC